MSSFKISSVIFCVYFFYFGEAKSWNSYFPEESRSSSSLYRDTPAKIIYWASGKKNITVYDKKGMAWYCYTYRQAHCTPMGPRMLPGDVVLSNDQRPTTEIRLFNDGEYRVVNGTLINRDGDQSAGVNYYPILPSNRNANSQDDFRQQGNDNLKNDFLTRDGNANPSNDFHQRGENADSANNFFQRGRNGHPHNDFLQKGGNISPENDYRQRGVNANPGNDFHQREGNANIGNDYIQRGLNSNAGDNFHQRGRDSNSGDGFLQTGGNVNRGNNFRQRGGKPSPAISFKGDNDKYRSEQTESSTAYYDPTSPFPGYYDTYAPYVEKDPTDEGQKPYQYYPETTTYNPFSGRSTFYPLFFNDDDETEDQSSEKDRKFPRKIPSNPSFAEEEKETNKIPFVNFGRRYQNKTRAPVVWRVIKTIMRPKQTTPSQAFFTNRKGDSSTLYTPNINSRGYNPNGENVYDQESRDFVGVTASPTEDLTHRKIFTTQRNKDHYNPSHHLVWVSNADKRGTTSQPAIVNTQITVSSEVKNSNLISPDEKTYRESTPNSADQIPQPVAPFPPNLFGQLEDPRSRNKHISKDEDAQFSNNKEPKDIGGIRDYSLNEETRHSEKTHTIDITENPLFSKIKFNIKGIRINGNSNQRGKNAQIDGTVSTVTQKSAINGETNEYSTLRTPTIPNFSQISFDFFDPTLENTQPQDITQGETHKNDGGILGSTPNSIERNKNVNNEGDELFSTKSSNIPPFTTTTVIYLNEDLNKSTESMKKITEQQSLNIAEQKSSTTINPILRTTVQGSQKTFTDEFDFKQTASKNRQRSEYEKPLKTSLTDLKDDDEKKPNSTPFFPPVSLDITNQENDDQLNYGLSSDLGINIKHRGSNSNQEDSTINTSFQKSSPSIAPNNYDLFIIKNNQKEDPNKKESTSEDHNRFSIPFERNGNIDTTENTAISSKTPDPTTSYLDLETTKASKIPNFSDVVFDITTIIPSGDTFSGLSLSIDGRTDQDVFQTNQDNEENLTTLSIKGVSNLKDPLSDTVTVKNFKDLKDLKEIQNRHFLIKNNDGNRINPVYTPDKSERKDFVEDEKKHQENHGASTGMSRDEVIPEKSLSELADMTQKNRQRGIFSIFKTKEHLNLKNTTDLSNEDVSVSTHNPKLNEDKFSDTESNSNKDIRLIKQKGDRKIIGSDEDNIVKKNEQENPKGKKENYDYDEDSSKKKEVPNLNLIFSKVKFDVTKGLFKGDGFIDENAEDTSQPHTNPIFLNIQSEKTKAGETKIKDIDFDHDKDFSIELTEKNGGTSINTNLKDNSNYKPDDRAFQDEQSTDNNFNLSFESTKIPSDSPSRAKEIEKTLLIPEDKIKSENEQNSEKDRKSSSSSVSGSALVLSGEEMELKERSKSTLEGVSSTSFRTLLPNSGFNDNQFLRRDTSPSSTNAINPQIIFQDQSRTTSTDRRVFPNDLQSFFTKLQTLSTTLPSTSTPTTIGVRSKGKSGKIDKDTRLKSTPTTTYLPPTITALKDSSSDTTLRFVTTPSSNVGSSLYTSTLEPPKDKDSFVPIYSKVEFHPVYETSIKPIFETTQSSAEPTTSASAYIIVQDNIEYAPSYTVSGEPCTDYCAQRLGHGGGYLCTKYRSSDSPPHPTLGYCTYEYGLSHIGVSCPIQKCISYERQLPYTCGADHYCTPPYLIERAIAWKKLMETRAYNQDSSVLTSTTTYLGNNDLLKSSTDASNIYGTGVSTSTILTLLNDDYFAERFKDVVVARAYTVFGEPCRDDCRLRNGENVTTCTKLSANSKTENFCTPSSSITYKGNVCEGKCESRGKSYFWCFTKDDNDVGFCTPSVLLEKSKEWDKINSPPSFSSNIITVPVAPAYTIYGEPCSDTCDYKGSAFTWCSKEIPSQTGQWSLKAYCTYDPSLTHKGDKCQGECIQGGYTFYWCRRNDKTFGFCTPKALIDKSKLWREKVAYTVYGEECANKCARYGYSYFWCKKKKPSNIGTWSSSDYCSIRSELTSKNERCLNECDRRGYPYYWCHTESGSYGYCSPKISFNQNGTVTLGPRKSWTKTNDTQRTPKAYTVFGEPCINACERRDGYSYTWCTKAQRSNIGTWTWADYCTNDSQITPYGEPCVDECKNRGYDFSWCHKNSLWGYCTPNKLLNLISNPQ